MLLEIFDNGISDSGILRCVADEDVRRCFGALHRHLRINRRRAPSRFGRISRHFLPPHCLPEDAPSGILGATCGLSAAFLRLGALVSRSGMSAMAALRKAFRHRDRPELAACCRIGLPIADIQHENPRGVGKGRLLTQSGHSRLTAFGLRIMLYAPMPRTTFFSVPAR